MIIELPSRKELHGHLVQLCSGAGDILLQNPWWLTKLGICLKSSKEAEFVTN